MAKGGQKDHSGMNKETYDRHYAANKYQGGHHGIEVSPAKQVGIVDPLAQQQMVQPMTNVPPQQANTLGTAQPVFKPQAQQAAQGIYGGIEQRQNAVGASALFQKKLLWQPQDEQLVPQEMIKEKGFKPSRPELIKQPEQHGHFKRFEEHLPIRDQKMYIDTKIEKVKPQRL